MHWRRKWQPTPVFLPGESQGWRSLAGCHSLLGCTESDMENPMDGGAWRAAVHGVSKSRTRLRDFTLMHWRRKWQPTPVFLPGESQGWRSLVGCRLWGHTVARTWKQPRCPSADEWIRKLWFIYTMEYYSAIKKNT